MQISALHCILLWFVVLLWLSLNHTHTQKKKSCVDLSCTVWQVIPFYTFGNSVYISVYSIFCTFLSCLLVTCFKQGTLSQNLLSNSCKNHIIWKYLPYLTSCGFVGNVIFGSWKQAAKWKWISDAQQGSVSFTEAMFAVKPVCRVWSSSDVVQDSGHWPRCRLWLTRHCLSVDTPHIHGVYECYVDRK